MDSNIIFLSGASSSGKSALRRELLTTIARPNVIGLEVDGFFKAMSAETFAEPGNFERILPVFVDAFHKVVATYANSGFLVIVDSLFQEKSWFENFCQNTQLLKTYWVCVCCPLEELVRREIFRGDRKLGLAASQYEKVHLWPSNFDCKVDTSRISPQSCAAEILKAISC